MIRDTFEELLHEAEDEIEADVRREGRLVPDFAAVVEAARARDPERIPAEALAEALALAPGEPREPSVRLVVRSDEEFAALLAEARAEIDADVARVREVGPPPMRAAPAGWRRRWPWIAAAAAAAVLLAFGAGPLLSRGEAEAVTGSQAAWQEVQPEAREVESAAPSRGVRERGAEEARPEEAPELPVEVETPPQAPVAPSVEAPKSAEAEEKQRAPRSVGPKRSHKREGVQERLRLLGEEAEALWQGGDLAGAEARYREIVALAPGARAADLAYGDLFSLARLRHGGEQEAALWREYLAVFPRGRYADDARAGLCRRAEGEAQRECWTSYLMDFPAGVHRRQADRALAGTGG